MTEERKPPFFINTKRLQRAQGYFEIGRTSEKVRRLIDEKLNRRTVVFTPEDVKDYGLVGYYGIKRFIQLDANGGDGESEGSDEEDVQKVDEDVQYQNTSMFSLFWMAFKNIAASIGEHLSLPKNAHRRIDPESGTGVKNSREEEMCKILIHPSSNDPRIQEDLIVYGDMKYLIQKFRMNLKKGGGVDVALFSVELPQTDAAMIKTSDTTDLQSFVVAPECGSLVWIENGRASAIFITKSSDDFFGSMLEWFRKLLSDMTLADSVMIGHPYYWHPSVRRRLTRVMKYLKRLYRNLARKDRLRERQITAGSDNIIEVICPTNISKIVINEQPSTRLAHASTTHETLNVMLDHLVKKWFDDQLKVPLKGKSVEDVAKSYSSLRPPRQLPSMEDVWKESEFLESVTFMDFNEERQLRSTSSGSLKRSCIPSEDFTVVCHSSSRKPDVNYNLPAEGCNSYASSVEESKEKFKKLGHDQAMCNDNGCFNENQECSFGTGTTDAQPLH